MKVVTPVKDSTHQSVSTVRAAKSNPKLIVLISCYSMDAAGDFERLFKGCENVILLVPEDGEHLGLDVFAKGLSWLSR